MGHPVSRFILVAVCAVLSAGTAHAQAPTLPLNDFENTLGALGVGQTPAQTPTQFNEPPLAPAPRAECDAQSTPLNGEMQGRVTAADIASPQAEKGWTCNLDVVSHIKTPGGFRVWRFTDTNGHTCAFYDTAIDSSIAAVSLLTGPTQGVVVLDMTDPTKPVETARLTTIAMLKPHESLNLHPGRGLLAAELGTGGTAPGIMAIYDVKDDCRHPVLQSEYLAGPVGHESGFSPDGKTFWIGGGQGIIPVDVTNPKNPISQEMINIPSHGLTLSDDGNTLYVTNTLDGGLVLLDVSEVQARKPGAKVTEISRLSWETTSIPQNTNPMTIDGKSYLLEFDEFAFRFNPLTIADKAGMARIIDLSNPAKPKITSNLRLEVNMPENHAVASGDPAFTPGPMTTYAAHYCNIPRAVDPQIAACSFLNSGLRIFDIRDPEHPREVAYYIAPPVTNQGQKSDAAFSQPAFDPARREVYYTDAASGFWNVKLRDSVWPDPLGTASASKTCASRRTFRVRVRKPKRGRIVKVTAMLAGKRLAVRRSRGRHVLTVKLNGRVRSTVRVSIKVRTSTGATYSDSRTYHPCTRRS